jgi:hypothetical protein
LTRLVLTSGLPLSWRAAAVVHTKAWRALVIGFATLAVAACASAADNGYPQLPGTTATVAQPVLTPAEQQKVIDDLNAAKAKNEQSAQ